jgi:monofunctional biosynthetic peptidoglycan transglycosylase
LSQVSPALLRSVIAAEDAGFFHHGGVDWEALRKARAWNARHAKSGRIRGASTITMQCARNVFLWQGRTYVRKALEIWFTWLMEGVWSKRRILEVYLNVIEWGPGIYGVEAASRRSSASRRRDSTPGRRTAGHAARPAATERRRADGVRRATRRHDRPACGAGGFRQTWRPPRCDGKRRLVAAGRIAAHPSASRCAALAVLSDLNFAESTRDLSRRSGGAVFDEDGLLLWAGAHDLPVIVNGVMRTDPRVPPADLLAAARRFFARRDRGFTVITRGAADADLCPACEAAGLVQMATCGLVLDRIPDARRRRASSAHGETDADAASFDEWAARRARPTACRPKPPPRSSRGSTSCGRPTSSRSSGSPAPSQRHGDGITHGIGGSIVGTIRGARQGARRALHGPFRTSRSTWGRAPCCRPRPWAIRYTAAWATGR